MAPSPNSILPHTGRQQPFCVARHFSTRRDQRIILSPALSIRSFGAVEEGIGWLCIPRAKLHSTPHPPLAGLHEIFQPLVIDRAVYPFVPTQLRDCNSSPDPFAHDADLLFGGKLPSGHLAGAANQLARRLPRPGEGASFDSFRSFAHSSLLFKPTI